MRVTLGIVVANSLLMKFTPTEEVTFVRMSPLPQCQGKGDGSKLLKIQQWKFQTLPSEQISSVYHARFMINSLLLSVSCYKTGYHVLFITSGPL